MQAFSSGARIFCLRKRHAEIRKERRKWARQKERGRGRGVPNTYPKGFYVEHFLKCLAKDDLWKFPIVHLVSHDVYWASQKERGRGRGVPNTYPKGFYVEHF